MRILFTTDYLDRANIGGSGRVIVELATRLSIAGHDVTVLGGAPAAETTTVEIDGTTLRWVSFPYDTGGSRGLGFLFRTRREIRAAFQSVAGDFDIVIHNQPFTAAAIGRVSVPSVYIFHSPWPLEYLADRFGVDEYAASRKNGPRTFVDVSLRRHIERRAVSRINRMVTLSETMKNHAMDIHGVDSNKISVLPGGVDLERFHPVTTSERDALRERWLGTEDGFIVTCVRRLIPRTGVDMLLDSLAEGGPVFGSARFLIAGKGPDRERLMARTRRLGLEERVSFLGYVPDEELADLYRAADLALVPTRALEGFGLSTLEALACGTPVAATPVGGSVEILRPLHPGLLAQDVSAAGLRNLLERWIRHPLELGRLRTRVRAHVEDRYSWDRMGAALDRLIRRAVPSRREIAV